MINDVCVIIPAYNPDEQLFLKFAKEVLNNFSKIVVVNDGSNEDCNGTFKKIAELDERIQVLNHSVNMGKGRALKTAFNYVLNAYPDCIGVVAADCDGQHGIEDVIKCAEELKNHPSSLILGVRDFNKDDVPFKSRYGNKITRIIFKLFIGLSIKDTQTGLRALSRELMKTFLTTNGERYEYETNMLIECKQNNIPIEQVPISTIYIEKNQTSKFNPIKDSLSIYKLFGKYIISAISSFVIDVILFNIFLLLLNKYEVPNSIIIATVIARVLSSLYNFKINAKMVFKNMTNKSLIRYIILVIIQMLISAFGVNYLATIIPINVTVIKVCVDIIIFMVNFVVQREFVFK
jgi:putative flippase GtrA